MENQRPVARWPLTLAIILIAIGLISLIVFNFYTFVPSGPDRVRVPVRGPGTPSRTGGFAGNGEQIFFTGISSRGTIRTAEGPFWFQMHGGGCATCHGPDGKGGTVVMMGSFEAPNITYKVLTGEAPGEEDHAPYTDALIRRAITQGIDSSEEELSNNMPRWQMADQDVNDVIDYLRTLDP